MISVNRIEQSITGACDGVRYSLNYTAEKLEVLQKLANQAAEVETMVEYDAIVEQFRKEATQSYSEYVATKSKHLVFNEAQGKYYLLLPNGSRDPRALPEPLVERILKSIELDIDIEPLIKFWIRAIRPVKGKFITEDKLKRLVNYVNYKTVDTEFRDQLIRDKGVSLEVATEAATFYQVPITMEGLLCTYKVSKELNTKFDSVTGKVIDRYAAVYDEDTGEKHTSRPNIAEELVFEPAVMGTMGDAFWCEALSFKKLGHVIRVGARHYLDSPDKVDQRDSISCVKGLHVGNTDYIRGYHHAGTQLHEVFVDPADVFAITDDGSGALRVLSYFVYKVHSTPNRGIYHSSKYAALKDAEWAAMKLEIQQELAESQKSVLESFESENAVLDAL